MENSMDILLNFKNNQAQWLTPVIPDTQETEMGKIEA
jgi:hypothetical protein